MTMTDQSLLVEYAQGGHAAFRVLLERHAGLVYGVAVRLTRDGSAAEEVVQDVFALLARKARQLASHPSVVGWLHHTAINTARHLRRSRFSHDRKLVQYAEAQSLAGGADLRTPATSEPFEEVDAALGKLPQEEREAILLRFFEDLDYREMAARLGITEAAARKRVSRGLRCLQQSLRHRSIKGVALAGMAFPIPSEAMGRVTAELAGAATHPFSIVPSFIAHMTKKTVVQAASITFLGGALLWYGADRERQMQRLRSEADQARAELAAIVESTQFSDSTNTQLRPASSRGADSQADASVVQAQVLELKNQIDEERQRRLQTETDLKSLRARVAPLADEVVVAYGTVGSIGSKMGMLYTEARALHELEQKGLHNTLENQARWAKFDEQVSSMSGLSPELVAMENSPAEGGRFFASAYAAAFGLGKDGESTIREFFERQLTIARERNLTLSRHPEAGVPEAEAWAGNRRQFFDESHAELRALLPVEKRTDFDQWAEQGAYGFRGVEIKGERIGFSLGDDSK